MLLTPFQLTPLGLFHTLLSIFAVVAAFVALFLDQQISPDTRAGRVYLASSVPAPQSPSRKYSKRCTSVPRLRLFTHLKSGLEHGRRHGPTTDPDEPRVVLVVTHPLGAGTFGARSGWGDRS